MGALDGRTPYRHWGEFGIGRHRGDLPGGRCWLDGGLSNQRSFSNRIRCSKEKRESFRRGPPVRPDCGRSRIGGGWAILRREPAAIVVSPRGLRMVSLFKSRTRLPP